MQPLVLHLAFDLVARETFLVRTRHLVPHRRRIRRKFGLDAQVKARKGSIGASVDGIPQLLGERRYDVAILWPS